MVQGHRVSAQRGGRGHADAHAVIGQPVALGPLPGHGRIAIGVAVPDARAAIVKQIVAQQEVETGRQNADHAPTGPVFCIQNRIFEVLRRRSHNRVNTSFQKDGEDLGDAFPSLKLCDKMVLGEARVRVAEKPVGANEHTWQAHAAYHGSRKFCQLVSSSFVSAFASRCQQIGHQMCNPSMLHGTTPFYTKQSRMSTNSIYYPHLHSGREMWYTCIQPRLDWRYTIVD